MPFVGSPGFAELMIIGVIALLLFGKRLPEVARSLGKGIVEFKKGVRGIEDEVDSATYSSTSYHSSSDRPVESDEPEEEASAPRFSPPSTAPVDPTTEPESVE